VDGRQGLALAFIRYSRAYVAEEEQAWNAKLGLWSGAFIAPWDWRHRNCKTVILGATMVPIIAQAQLCESACAVGAPSPNCKIKRNVNRKAERIYHLPSNLNCCNINMNKPGCRWFCSEEEAKAAGWRPAAR
jgi:hypothetical protein